VAVRPHAWCWKRIPIWCSAAKLFGGVGKVPVPVPRSAGTIIDMPADEPALPALPEAAVDLVKVQPIIVEEREKA